MVQHKRDAHCGELRAGDAGRRVTLNAWVHRVRDHGGIYFLNVRDRSGIVQVVVDDAASAELRSLAAELRMEFCIALSGAVRERPQEMRNPDMATGEVEVLADSIQILSRCAELPFVVADEGSVREDLRFQYRYLDLRTSRMQHNIALRHRVTGAIRSYLAARGFYEVETPTMIRSTPEGARDFLVPSRLHPGEFYALPQSPQLYKQLLMVSGIERYFQIAHCFRDEDARGDRQPEHTQIDIEMSFVSPDDVFEVVEGMLADAFQRGIGVELHTPFARMPYADAMNRYGSDKPDLRFGLELQDAGSLMADSEFRVFADTVAGGGTIKALVARGCADYSRKQITELESHAQRYGAKGLAWTKLGENGLDGGIGRFLSAKAEEITGVLDAEPGDLLLFVADPSWKRACTALGAVRSLLGQQLSLHENGFHFAWIVDFPMFEWDQDGQKWEAAHHMFTMPQERFLESLEQEPGAVLGDLYDLVCNGLELASGSIRIHDPDLQRRIFSIVGFDPEEAQRRFGFLLEAFRFGPPPHGGIAPGLDRLVMLMAGEQTIRDVIAFPKNTTGVSAIDFSPGPVDASQLAELGLSLLPGVEPGERGSSNPETATKSAESGTTTEAR